MLEKLRWGASWRNTNSRAKRVIRRQLGLAIDLLAHRHQRSECFGLGAEEARTIATEWIFRSLVAAAVRISDGSGAEDKEKFEQLNNVENAGGAIVIDIEEIMTRNWIGGEKEDHEHLVSIHDRQRAVAIEISP